MRIGYGWPKVYSTNARSDEDEKDGSTLGDIIGVGVLKHYVVLAFRKGLQLWDGGQHRIKYASFVHPEAAIKDEGFNYQLAASFDNSRAAVLTTASYVHLFRVSSLRPDAVLPAALLSLSSTLDPAELLLTQSLDARSLGSGTAIAADVNVVAVAFESRLIVTYSWSGHLRQVCDPLASPLTQELPPRATITHILHDSNCPELALILSDGSAALCISDPQQKYSGLEHFEVGGCISATAQLRICAGAISATAGLLALGCEDGVTRLWDLSGSWQVEPLRQLSLVDWGYGADATGPVETVAWTPDGEALAVGYRQQGLVVWTPSGCRIMSSLRQASLVQESNPDAYSAFGSGGISALAWGPSGLRLMLAERDISDHLLEIQFVRPARKCNHLQSGAPPQNEFGSLEVHVLHADDRLLLVMEAVNSTGVLNQARLNDGADSNDLTVSHVPVPHSYTQSAWPIRLVSVAPSTLDIAVAGSQGFTLFDRRSGKWRLFGDIGQERAFRAMLLGWLPDIVVVVANPSEDASASSGPAGGQAQAASPADATGSQLFLYSRYFLDTSSILLQQPLSQEPAAMDCRQGHILLLFHPLNLLLLRADVAGAHTVNRRPSVSLAMVRELNLLTISRPIADVCIVMNRRQQAPEQLSRCRAKTYVCEPESDPPQIGSNDLDGKDVPGSPTLAPENQVHSPRNTKPRHWRSLAPTHCVLLRWGGLLSMLDLDTGQEVQLLKGVESVWLSAWLPTVQTPSWSQHFDKQSASGTGLLPLQSRPSSLGAIEMPWWVYTPQGVSLIFPSALHQGIDLGDLMEGSMGAGTLAGGLLQADQELEFDPEVLPIGVSLADAALVGITQRLRRAVHSTVMSDSKVHEGSSNGKAAMTAANAHAYCLLPIPQSQPVLPCLLRRLIQRGDLAGARLLACHHSYGPHFSRSLEWLIFTALESQYSGDAASVSAPPSMRGGKHIRHASNSGTLVSPNLPDLSPLPAERSPLYPPRPPLPPPRPPLVPAMSPLPPTVSQHGDGDEGATYGDGGSAAECPTLLEAAADLVRGFPQWLDVVVNVSRKTDATMWPLLFSAVGQPSGLLEMLLKAGQVHTASCLLVVVDSVQGPETAHALALRLVHAAMHDFECDLCAELLRFLYPPVDLPAELDFEPTGVLSPRPSGFGSMHVDSWTRDGSVGDLLRDTSGMTVASAASPAAAGMSGRVKSIEGSLNGRMRAPSGSHEVVENGRSKAAELRAQGKAATDDGAMTQRTWMQYFFGGESLDATERRESGSGVAGGAAADAAAVPSSTQSTTRGNSWPDVPNGNVSSDLKVKALRTHSGILGGPHSAEAAMLARQAVAAYAWAWLDDGHLLHLADLQRALALVPCSLAALMRTSPNESHAQMCADHVVSAMDTILTQLPCREDPSLLATAHDLLMLFYYIVAPSWRFAMALCLDQRTHLQAIRQRQPKIWHEVRNQILADQRLREIFPCM